jgi:protein-S-isoprenylcysteine O-methyltransferase Ste14
MIPPLIIASFLTICLAIFASINIQSIFRFSAKKRANNSKAEVERPTGLFIGLATVGTLAFFFEVVLYVILVFTGVFPIFTHSLIQLHFLYDSLMQLLGVLVTAFGYALFLWSVLARGRYATSWDMPEDQKLVTWGPYRYVRHPSYLAYFLLFIGWVLLFLNLLAAIPLLAIPGYMHVAATEEELLLRRFGEAYVQYQHTTGRFFPKIK